MTLWTELARTSTTAGDEIILRRCDTDYEIRFNGLELMSSRHHQSETLLAERSLRLHQGNPGRVLIGGLGLGFTLRTALDWLGDDSEVTVCELVPEIVDWSRVHFGGLTGDPLRDPRVKLEIDDVMNLLRRTSIPYDIILMDTDNGPDMIVREDNDSIYRQSGVELVQSCLTSGGILSFWSSTISDPFEATLNGSALIWRREDICLAGGRADAFHHIYFARHPDSESASLPRRTQPVT